MNKKAGRIVEIISQDCYKKEIDHTVQSKYLPIDFSTIGVEQEEFENDSIVQIAEKFDYIVYASDYGVVADVQQNMREKLLSAIKAIKIQGYGKKKLMLPKGKIFLYGSVDTDGEIHAVKIDGIDDFYLDGNGSTLMLDDHLMGIEVTNCKNVMIRNLNVDRIYLPYFMGRIEHMDVASGEAIVKVNEGYEVEDNFRVREYLEFDGVTKEPRYHGNFLYNNHQVDGSVLDIKSFKSLESNRAKIEFGCDINWAPPETSFVISRSMYGKDSMLINESENIIVENFNVYSSPGMGIKGISSKNIYFNRANIMCKPDTDRLMSVTADAMHFIDCSEDLHITNCLLENSHDDSLNVHGMYMMVTDIDNTAEKVKIAAARSVKFGVLQKDDHLTLPYQIDDKIELSKDRTLELKGLLTVTTCNQAEDYGYWITFKDGIANINKGDILSNITRTPKLVVRNCILRNKRNRGMLIQSRNALIENNTLYNVIMTGIQIMTDCATWYESVNPQNVIVRNNKFINTNIKQNNFGDFGNADIDICVYNQEGVGNAGLIRDILIENNAFINSGNAAVSINSAEDVVVKNNFIFHPCSETGTSPRNCAISVSHSRNLELTNNHIIPYDENDFLDVYCGDLAKEEVMTINNTIHKMKACSDLRHS